MTIFCKENNETYFINLYCANGCDCSQDIMADDDTIVYNRESDRYETDSIETIEWWEEYKREFDYVEDYVSAHEIPDEFYRISNADLMDEIKEKAEWIKDHETYFWLIDEKVGVTWGDDTPFPRFEEAKQKGDDEWDYLTAREKSDRVGFAIYEAKMDDGMNIVWDTAVKMFDYKEN